MAWEPSFEGAIEKCVSCKFFSEKIWGELILTTLRQKAVTKIKANIFSKFRMLHVFSVTYRNFPNIERILNKNVLMKKEERWAELDNRTL